MRHMSSLSYDELFRLHKTEGMSTRGIANILKCSASKVNTWLNWYGIASGRVKYPVNHGYFDSWSENMAYILGHATADACVSSSEPVLRYHVHRNDISILEFVRAELSPCRPLNNAYRDRHIKLDIWSQPIVARLGELGVIPKKTGRESVPEMSSDYLPHYLRGVFDGDGCLSVTIRSNGFKQRMWNIASASPTFLYQLREGCGFHTLGTIAKSHRCWKWSIQSTVGIRTITDYIYGRGGFALQRKREKVCLL